MKSMMCFYPGCDHRATHWIVRQLPADYVPNPDVRAYCDGHRFRDLDAAMAALHAPVVRAEFVDIDPRAWIISA
jgi:hypothetical protein